MVALSFWSFDGLEYYPDFTLQNYVEVWTERGTHLVLMRLSDAIRETAGENGLQIHRSHWVALGAVKRTLGPLCRTVIPPSMDDASNNGIS